MALWSRLVIFVAAACAASSSSALAQSAAPDSNLSATFLSVFETCPKLVEQGEVKSDFDLAAHGLKPAESGMGKWEGRFDDGLLVVDFEPEKRLCSASLSHPAYKRFGDFVMEQLSEEGYSMIVDKRTASVPGAVLAKFSSDKKRRSQFTIVQNPQGSLLTISFTEKANF